MDNTFKNPLDKKRKKNDLPKPNLEINPECEEVFFADPVHSLIGFSEKCMQIIDTPQYNRLRDLKQLGLTYLVFPSATHTRFEHSLGVGYLAGSLAKKIKKKQPNLEINDHDIELVKIAGLCHDLGHGPFSHAFETWVHKKDLSFKHEEMSQKIFEDLVNENAIDLGNTDINFIKDLIMGNRPSQKSFLSEIVSNSKCSLDVDKLDYLIRDSYHIGFSQKNQYLYQRLFANCRVLNNELCYHSKVSYDIYQVFSQRYDMFKRVYCHRVSLAIECMVSDVFDLSDPFLQISNKIYDSKEYTTLTDGIFNTIQISKDKELEKARDLIKRIQKRQLYKYVEQLILTPKEFSTIKDKINPEKLIEFKPKGSSLTPDDFVVKVQTMNFAFGEKNPMDNIRFYNKYEKETPFKLQDKEISNLLPSNFAEKYVTLFCKKNDKTLLEDIQQTLRNFTSCNDITSPGKKDFISPNHQSNFSRIN